MSNREAIERYFRQLEPENLEARFVLSTKTMGWCQERTITEAIKEIKKEAERLQQN